MQPRRRLVTSLGSALTFLLVLVAWVVFAPPQLGGQTSYVIVNGNSMEPGMHRGDLAVVRKADSYEVGDVVTYRHPEIGPVIHRIINREGARFVFQGDNNDFIDSYHPAQHELVGKLWFEVPGFGTWLARFHSPVYMFGLLVVAFAGIGGGAAIKHSSEAAARRNHRPNHDHPHRAPSRGASPMKQLLTNWQDTLSVLAAAAVASVALGWVAFSRPTHHEVPDNTPYTQSGTFEYSAATADGRVYDSGQATSGDPVYRRLSDAVAFKFSYQFDSGQRRALVAGTYHLVAELSDSNGWKRTIELTPETPFQGPAFAAEGTLSLAQAQQLIDVLETESGVQNDRYGVAIQPRVKVSGSIDSTSFEDEFEGAALPMSLDDVQLRLEKDTTLDGGNPLKPTAEGSIETTVSRANTVKLLVVSLPVAAARAIALIGVALAIVASGLLLIAWVNDRRPTGESPQRLNARLPVLSVERTAVPRARVVDLTSLQDLGRLAERLGAVVLQEARPGYHAFFVHDGDVTYRYQALGRTDEAASRGKGAA